MQKFLLRLASDLLNEKNTKNSRRLAGQGWYGKWIRPDVYLKNNKT
jgi:hypothetical protein